MRKSIVTLGLVGLLGIGYWASRHSTVESYVQAQAVELAESSDKALTHLSLKNTNAPTTLPQLSLMEYDQYRDYVNSINLTNTGIFREPEFPEVPGCNEQEIRRRHEETSQWVPHAETDCNLTWNVGTLIRLDRQLAYCKYQNDPERFKELMLEAAEHLESVNSNWAAGLIHYHFGNNEKARELFLLSKETGVDYLLKITPQKELAALADAYLQRDDPFDAGKVEWFQGDKELGRTLIEQSEYYKEMIKDINTHLSYERYKEAARELWDLKLPFHWELVRELCGENEECLRVFEKDKPF